MPVEVIGAVPGLPQRRGRVVQHRRHILRAGDGQALQQNAAALFQRQRVDRDVVGAEGQAPVQGTAEALRRIRRKPRNQIHIHMGESISRHQLHGRLNIGGGVAAADGPEDMVLHGLGVHRDPGDAVGLEHRQLFRGDGVRAACLHGDLVTVAAVKGLFKCRQHPVHLLRGEGGGSAAAHIERADPQPRLPHHFAAGADLLHQGVHIGGHQGKAPLHRLADKRTVGAAGGTEGDPHVHRDVLFAQIPGGPQGHPSGLHRQHGPVRGDEVLLFHHLQGLERRLPRRQRPGHRLIRPDAGEHPPGGRAA